jgi:toxin ParE1/3/4
MKVRVTDDATEDLRHIKAFISERDATAAEAVMHRIRRTLQLLAALPRLGHAGTVRGTYEIMVPRVPFLVVYRIDRGATEELIALRVYHTAQERSLEF